MKNRMHACLAVLTAIAVIAGITQGGMQSVLAAGKTITKSEPVASAKITVKNTIAEDNGSVSDSSIDIKVGLGSDIDIKVDETEDENDENVDLTGEVAGISTVSLQWPMLMRQLT